jgi:UTP:GlnB (protein PII) uridylyltransferase
MAREAGLFTHKEVQPELKAFEALVRADEREACAKVWPDWKAEYLKSVESGCITLDELREANAELDATNRQVEILSDALAESRRQRQWVGLTDDDLVELVKFSTEELGLYSLCLDVEAKLRSKNNG